MQLDAILEVAIGLVLMWLILSVATMEIQNWVAQIFGIRSKFLEQSIRDMFKNQQTLVDQFYNHPAIVELCKRDKKGRIKKPSYIPSEIFAEVCVEVFLNAGKSGEEIPPDEMSFDAIISSVEKFRAMNPDLSRLVKRLFPGLGYKEAYSFSIKDIDSKLAEYRGNIEHWFDNVMAQASGWYKVNALALAFWIGLVLAIIFNIDTINITQKLWREPTIRQALVAQADSFELQEGTINIAEVPGYFDSLALPLGWTTVPTENLNNCVHVITPDKKIAIWAGGECKVLVNVPAVNDPIGWAIKLLGFLISAFAARQGAPFWFDLLKKMITFKSKVTSDAASKK